MPTTSPDAIAYPDTSWAGGIVSALSTLATSIQVALAKRAGFSFSWADAPARGAQNGMVTGSTGIQLDTGVTYRYTGSAWVGWSSDWISYTPTITNFTVGTGGSTASVFEYKYITGRITVRYRMTLGSAGFAVGTAPTITLPVTPRNMVHAFQPLVGAGVIWDLSALAATSTAVFHRFSTTPNGALSIVYNPITPANITSTTPMTWAAGDSVDGEFTFDPA